MLNTEENENGKYCMSYPWHVISNVGGCVGHLRLLLPWFFSYCCKIGVLRPDIASAQPQPPPLQLSHLADRLSPASRAGNLTVRGTLQSCEAFYLGTQDQITTAASLLLTLKMKQNNWLSALCLNPGSLPTCPRLLLSCLNLIFVTCFGSSSQHPTRTLVGFSLQSGALLLLDRSA